MNLLAPSSSSLLVPTPQNGSTGFLNVPFSNNSNNINNVQLCAINDANRLIKQPIYRTIAEKTSAPPHPQSMVVQQNQTMQLYHCNDCSYKTPSLRKLGRHNSVNHAGVKYRCEMCDFVTGYQSNYYRHRKQV
uniref:C2H2-type domain-containing protein n=1 Tax=Romanomermis culicivorax TaxID=13658 RepID=A0A915K615_ROMCU